MYFDSEGSGIIIQITRSEVLDLDSFNYEY